MKRFGGPCGLAAAAVAAACLAAASGVQAQLGGLHISVGTGFAQGAATEVRVTGDNHPTHCDLLLYANPADAPTGGDCALPSALDGRFPFSPEMGFAGSVAAGFSLGALTAEVEWVRRAQTTGAAPLTVGDAAGEALTGKSTEWSAVVPPFGEILDFIGEDVFANLYYSFGMGGGPKPYLGVGAGYSSVSYQWYHMLVRKSISGGYLEAFGGSASNPDAAPEWQRAAAGTVSDLTHLVTESGLGYQALGGVELNLGSDVALDVRGRWVLGRDFQNLDVLWDQVRSHEPVRADGTTPFTSDLSFSKLGYWALTASLKYRL